MCRKLCIHWHHLYSRTFQCGDDGQNRLPLLRFRNRFVFGFQFAPEGSPVTEHPFPAFVLECHTISHLLHYGLITLGDLTFIVLPVRLVIRVTGGDACQTGKSCIVRKLR